MRAATGGLRLGGVAGFLAAAVTLGGCAGGVHQRGQHQVSLTGSYGIPIDGAYLWPDAEGRAENVGVTAAYNYFLRDRCALTAALSPYRLYEQSDGGTYAGEFQLGVRYYFWELDLEPADIGFFAELLGGLMHSSRSVPEEGTTTNFTQDTGVGFEVLFTKNISWITGYRLRHLSHGHVFGGSSNPSQNDHVVYTGIAITWN